MEQPANKIIKFLGYLEERCNCAFEKVGVVERYYQIAGYTICLRFAGSVMIPYITPAIEHLRVDSITEPNLTVHLWDCVISGVKMTEPLPWSKEDYWYRGEINSFNNKDYKITYQNDNIVNAISLSQNKAFFWVYDPYQIPFNIIGAPLFNIFLWWFNKQGLKLVHTGAIGLNGKGVLIAGKGGAGKSMTCLNCLLYKDICYISDDFCLLKKDGFACNLYNSGKLEVEHLADFPQLIPMIYKTDKINKEKSLFILQQEFSNKIVKQLKITAILIPQITQKQETEIIKAPSIAAIKALLPVILLLPYAYDNNWFEIIKKYISGFDCYYLKLGSDLSLIPEKIYGFLQQ